MHAVSPRDFSRAVAADEVDHLLGGGAMSAAEVAAALGPGHARACDDDDDFFCGQDGWGVEVLGESSAGLVASVIGGGERSVSRAETAGGSVTAGGAGAGDGDIAASDLGGSSLSTLPAPPLPHGSPFPTVPPRWPTPMSAPTGDGTARARGDEATRDAAVRLAHSVRVDAIAVHEMSRAIGAVRGQLLRSLTDRILSRAAALSRLHAQHGAAEARKLRSEQQRAEAMVARTLRAEAQARTSATLCSGASANAADAGRDRAAARARAAEAERAAEVSAGEVAALRQIAAAAAELISREAARVESFATPTTGVRSEGLRVSASLRDVARLLQQTLLCPKGEASAHGRVGTAAAGHRMPMAGSPGRGMRRSQSAAVGRPRASLDYRQAIGGLRAAADAPDANGLTDAAEAAGALGRLVERTELFLTEEEAGVEAQQGGIDTAGRLKHMMMHAQAQPAIGQPVFTG